ncbi:MAG TPA: tyrosine-type recombinase/integrase [Sphingomonas sp.]
MTPGFKWARPFRDRHGKQRYRFRRVGYPVYNFKSPFGTKAFEREYAACLERDAAPVGVTRVAPGSVSDVIARYYADNAFQDLRPATQAVYRGVLERFRDKFGNDPLKAFDAERIGRLMTAMRAKPHAAARLRKLLASLFKRARVAKLVPHDFDPIKDTSPPKADTVGYHRWTEDELAAFEAKHALGTKPRLAFALLLYSAQRSGDVRFITVDAIASGRIQLDQSKTSNAVDVPVIAPLAEALAAGPIGKVTVLEARGGQPFTPKGFYQMMKRACIDAGLPHCTPHGLRKAAARRCREAGCTDDEGMTITGHTSVREYRRYAGADARGTTADTASSKVLANLPQRVAKEHSQPIEEVSEMTPAWMPREDSNLN